MNFADCAGPGKDPSRARRFAAESSGRRLRFRPGSTGFVCNIR
jgi:hypothetical protein